MLKPLSPTEWLNDLTTHMAKSGPVLRSRQNDRLTDLGNLVPRSFQNMPVEYDINYESPKETIRGYKLTDLFTNCIWLSPCNSSIVLKTFKEIVDRPPTQEGVDVLSQVVNSLSDKYLQRPVGAQTIDKIALLPGSNLLLKSFVDMKKLDKAVEEGAYIKPHPISNRLDLSRFTQRYGDRVISSRSKVYPLIRKASVVYTTTNSETGLAAIMLGKRVGILDDTSVGLNSTYSVFYRSIYKPFDEGQHSSARQRLASIFSYPETGVLSIHHSNPTKRIEALFNTYAGYLHRRDK